MESILKTGVIQGQNHTEIVDPEFRKFIIDVSIPSQRIGELDFLDYRSEMCLEHADIVGHIAGN